MKNIIKLILLTFCQSSCSGIFVGVSAPISAITDIILAIVLILVVITIFFIIFGIAKDNINEKDKASAEEQIERQKNVVNGKTFFENDCIKVDNIEIKNLSAKVEEMSKNYHEFKRSRSMSVSYFIALYRDHHPNLFQWIFDDDNLYLKKRIDLDKKHKTMLLEFEKLIH